MTLAERIEKVKAGLRQGTYASESAVSQGILLSILHGLGWDASDTSLVIPEYSIEGRRVDYALWPPGRRSPSAFVEVKKVGKLSEKADRQLFEYAFLAGVQMAILTDGREWCFYLPVEQGHYSERLAYEFDLLEEETAEALERLRRYLSYERIRSGEALQAARADYQNVVREREVKRTFPQAWNALLEGRDSLLSEMLAEKVQDLSGYKPDLEACGKFLQSIPPMRVAEEPTLVEQPSLSLSQQRTRGAVRPKTARASGDESIVSASKGAKMSRRPSEKDLFDLFKKANPYLLYVASSENSRTGVPQGQWIEWQADCWKSLDLSEVLRRIRDFSPQASRSPSAILTQAQAFEKLLRVDRQNSEQWNVDGRYFLDSEGKLFDLATSQYVEAPTQDIRVFRRMGTTVDFAESETWSRALRLWSGDDPDLVAYWQRLFGYCLLPGNPEQVFFYLYGTGANGKTQWLDALEAIFGELAGVLSNQIFVRSRQRSDLALLEEKRVACVEQELPTGSRGSKALALLEELAGGQEVPPYKQPYSIPIHAKIFLQGSTKLPFTDTSRSRQRRVQVLPFTQMIPEKDRDKYFFKKLEKELPKILGWAIRGYKMFQADGLAPSAAALAATGIYSENRGNAVSRYVSDRLTPSQGHRIQAKKLFEDYRRWRAEQGDRNDSTLSSRGFRRCLEEMGLNVGQANGKNGKVYWLFEYDFRLG